MSILCTLARRIPQGSIIASMLVCGVVSDAFASSDFPHCCPVSLSLHELQTVLAGCASRKHLVLTTFRMKLSVSTFRGGRM